MTTQFQTENRLAAEGYHAASVTEFFQKFPNLPLRVLAALLAAEIFSRSVTPQRVCACGCGAFVTGKALSASPACRKRLERQRRAAAGIPARQFNLVLQDEFPVKIPTVPVPVQLPPAPSDQSSAQPTDEQSEIAKICSARYWRTRPIKWAGY